MLSGIYVTNPPPPTPVMRFDCRIDVWCCLQPEPAHHPHLLHLHGLEHFIMHWQWCAGSIDPTSSLLPDVNWQEQLVVCVWPIWIPTLIVTVRYINAGQGQTHRGELSLTRDAHSYQQFHAVWRWTYEEEKGLQRGCWCERIMCIFIIHWHCKPIFSASGAWPEINHGNVMVYVLL